MGFEYSYNYPFDIEQLSELTGVVAVLGVIYLLINILYIAFIAVAYVLESLGLYTVAKRREIHHGWLAWIPVARLWIVGSISDQYQYVTKGKIKNRRKVLLGLCIGLLPVYFLWLFVTLSVLFMGNELLALLLIVFGGLALVAALIWLIVCQYMACYDFFRSCDPENAVLFLALSILFPVTLPFFMFACRKKDGGMPPRKQAPVIEIVEPVEEPIVEEGFARPEEFEEE